MHACGALSGKMDRRMIAQQLYDWRPKIRGRLTRVAFSPQNPPWYKRSGVKRPLIRCLSTGSFRCSFPAT